jgi:GTP:adenosylcobinamide-phosphate guanylyltransferase
VDAVVMAAGRGERLRPLTDRWPKPVLPVDGRPVVATLLHELAAAGFAEVVVVVGHLAEQVEALLGDGSGFGVRVRYAVQPERHGSADAVLRAFEAGARGPLLVTAADTVYRPGDIALARAAWSGATVAGGLAVRPLAPPELRHQTRVSIRDGRLVRLGGEGDRVGGATLTAAPLWYLGESLTARLPDLPGPPYELAEAARAALEAGEEVTVLDVGPTRDLTSPDDVVLRNFAYLWNTG